MVFGRKRSSPSATHESSQALLRVFRPGLGERVLVIEPGDDDLVDQLAARGAAVAMTRQNGRSVRDGAKCWKLDVDYPWRAPLEARFDTVLIPQAVATARSPEALLDFALSLAPRVLVGLAADSYLDEPRLSRAARAAEADCAWGKAARGKVRVVEFARWSDRLSPLLVHIHVPKTAGQSVSAMLEEQLAPGRVVYFYP